MSMAQAHCWNFIKSRSHFNSFKHFLTIRPSVRLNYLSYRDCRARGTKVGSGYMVQCSSSSTYVVRQRFQKLSRKLWDLLHIEPPGCRKTSKNKIYTLQFLPFTNQPKLCLPECMCSNTKPSAAQYFCYPEATI